MTGIGAVFVAGYLTWRDQQQTSTGLQRQIESFNSEPAKVAMPAASFEVKTHDGVVFIDLTNKSDIQATFMVEVMVKPAVAGYSRFEAAWTEGPQGARLIPAGQMRTIRLAVLYANSGMYQWAFLTPRKREPQTHRVSELLTEVSHVRMGSSWEVRVEVAATPQLPGGVALRTIRFDGADVLDLTTGSRLHIVPDAVPKAFGA